MKKHNIYPGKTTGLFLSIALLFVANHAAASPELETALQHSPYGFGQGLIHGLLLPFRFIYSLFNDLSSMYDFNNKGLQYDLGIFMGIFSLFIACERAAFKIRKHKYQL